ncbi:MAG: PHP domain-containing protein [Limnochordia bacterium]
MRRQLVIGVLKDTARMLELAGESFYRVRAYNNAVMALLKLDADFEELVQQDRLREIPGVGAGIEQSIREILDTGTTTVYVELAQEIPPTLLDLYNIPGLGTKRIRYLYDTLQITNLGELEYACQENRLLTLKGFGPKSQADILAGIKTLRRYQQSYLYPDALGAALQLKTLLEEITGGKVLVSGELRRGLEVVGKIELLVAGISQGDLPDVPEQSAAGIPVELHFTSKERWGTDAILTTGSAAHIDFLGSLAPDGELPIAASEEECYAQLGLEFIPPELREGILETSRTELPQLLAGLVTDKDLKGVFHNHSNYSDGTNTLAEIAEHGRSLGWSFIGIGDHSQSAIYAGGLNADDLLRQMAEIDEVNAKYSDFKLLKGLEVDILSDGSLDCSDDLLSELDYVIASVHSAFKMSEREMTQRVLKAVSNPHVNMLGHPTGRLLLAREPYAIDLDAVIDACREHDVAIEINANPHRLDLDWRWAHRAYERGVLLAINPDAHSLAGYNDTRYGLNMARKAGLPREVVLNTWDITALLEKFRQKGK